MGGDISRYAVDIARRARFGPRAVASIPADYRQRFLRPIGDEPAAEYEFTNELRQRVRFMTTNLVDADGFSATHDIIFCHNVLIYFSPAAVSQAVTFLASRLTLGGYLLLGPGEAPSERPHRARAGEHQRRPRVSAPRRASDSRGARMTTSFRSIQATALTLFTEEFQTNLPQILTALDTVEHDRSNRAAAKEAHRLIHALKGGAAMVGLAAFGYLLNVAEEIIEESTIGSRSLSDEAIETLRGSMPRFAAYMEAAIAGQPVEQLANGLARALRLGGGAADVDALKNLIELEANEVAQLPTEHVDGEVPDAQPIEAVATWTQVVEPEPEPEPEVEAQPEPPPEPELAAAPLPEIEDDEAVVVEASEEERVGEAPAPVAIATLEFDVVMKDDVPPELAEVFGEEAKEHLETIARLTTRLSTELHDRESVQELRRAVHTLKGAAGVVGYKGASKLAHRMEDLLDRLYDGTAAVTPHEARVLASSSDALHDLIAGTADPDALRSLVIRLFGEFDGLMGTMPAPVPMETIAALAGADAVADVEPDAGVLAVPEVPASAPVQASEGAQAADRRRSASDRRAVGGQALRVPVQRLNELVRVVSELVINRSTFEQHHGALIEQVDELKLSTARLRRVTHRLESEYEVRALAGNIAVSSPAPTASGGHEFDELEFDRYTEFHLLTRELTETASDIATIGARVAATIGDFDSDLTRLGRLTREVQDKTMEFRMVPLGTLETQLERTARSTAESCGKLVEFAMEGAHVALDKSLLEQMADPLLHLLRNAIDHGIESRQLRVAAGKSERGQITVRAFHEGTDVLIEVRDDGAGLNIERIRKLAVERGLVTDAVAAGLTPEAVQAFIFEPGFSTASAN